MNASRRSRLVALTALPLLVLASACSSGSSDSGDLAVESDRPEAGASSEPATDYSDTASTRSRNADNAGGGQAEASEPIQRSVISTGTVSLTGDDVAATRREVQRIVDAHGGTVGEEEAESGDDGKTAYVRMVLRIPVADFDKTMAALEEADHLVASSRSSEDVTTQVIDTDVRVRAQEKSIERITELLARAERLQQVVWIESQLTDRQAELDSLRQQQAWLKDQTSLSTITVDIERQWDDSPVTGDDEGFLAGLASGWEALGSTFTSLATVTGALLPFAVVLVVLGAPVWLLLRRLRRNRRKDLCEPLSHE